MATPSGPSPPAATVSVTSKLNAALVKRSMPPSSSPGDAPPGGSAWIQLRRTLRDLPVGPADTDRHAPHQQGAVLHTPVRDLLDAGGPLLAQHDRHSAHMRTVAPGCRNRLTQQG